MTTSPPEITPITLGLFAIGAIFMIVILWAMVKIMNGPDVHVTVQESPKRKRRRRRSRARSRRKTKSSLRNGNPKTDAANDTIGEHSETGSGK